MQRNSEQFILNMNETITIQYNEELKRWDMFYDNGTTKKLITSKKYKNDLISLVKSIKCGLTRIEDIN